MRVMQSPVTIAQRSNNRSAKNDEMPGIPLETSNNTLQETVYNQKLK